MAKLISKTGICFLFSMMLIMHVSSSYAFFKSGTLPIDEINNLVVGIYFDYDFSTNVLTVFWKDDSTIRTSYTIKIYKRIESTANESCAYSYEDEPSFEKEISTTARDNMTTFSNFPLGKYNIIITGVENNISSKLFENEFWVTLLPLRVKYAWCYNEATEKIRTRLYINRKAQDNFKEYVDLNSDRRTFSDNYNFEDKIYLVILNYERLSDCNKVMSSDLGNQTIGYAVSPPIIDKDNIILKQCP